jgi:hypothetical protein
MGIITVIVLAVLVVGGVIGYGWNVRQNLMRLHVAADDAWEKVLDALAEGAVFLPMLVHKVREYTSFEKDVFRDADYAVNAANEVRHPNELTPAENATRDVLRRICELAKLYPPLSADADYLDLKARSKDNEMSVQFAREAYNRNAKEFNRRIQETVWGRYWASQLNFRQRILIDLMDNRVPHADGERTRLVAPTMV